LATWDNGRYVTGVPGVKQVEVGHLCGCMRKDDDTIECFGPACLNVPDDLGPVKDFAMTKSETHKCGVAVNVEGNVIFFGSDSSHFGTGCGLLNKFGSRSETVQVTTDGIVKKVFLDPQAERVCAQKMDDTLICMGQYQGDWFNWLQNKDGITRLVHDGDTNGGIAINWKVKEVAFSSFQMCFVMLQPVGELRCVGHKEHIQGRDSANPEWMQGLPSLEPLDSEDHPVYRSASLSNIGVSHIYSSQDYMCALTIKHHLRCWSRGAAYVPHPGWDYGAGSKIAHLGIDKDDDEHAPQVWSFATGIRGSRYGRMLAILKGVADEDGKLIQWGVYMNENWNLMPKEFYSCENPYSHHGGNGDTSC